MSLSVSIYAYLVAWNEDGKMLSDFSTGCRSCLLLFTLCTRRTFGRGASLSSVPDCGCAVQCQADTVEDFNEQGPGADPETSEEGKECDLRLHANSEHVEVLGTSNKRALFQAPVFHIRSTF